MECVESRRWEPKFRNEYGLGVLQSLIQSWLCDELKIAKQFVAGSIPAIRTI